MTEIRILLNYSCKTLRMYIVYFLRQCRLYIVFEFFRIFTMKSEVFFIGPVDEQVNEDTTWKENE